MEQTKDPVLIVGRVATEAPLKLKICGYEVVPDVLETDGGTWEFIILIYKVHHTFSIHDVDWLLSCSYHLTSAAPHGVSTEGSEDHRIDFKARPRGIERAKYP